LYPCAKGRQHDFSLFKASHVLIHPDSQLLADSGYQGLNKYHNNSTLPIEKREVPDIRDKAHNKALSKRRILIENINRLGKIGRSVKVG
jgi:hypothetical protein